MKTISLDMTLPIPARNGSIPPDDPETTCFADDSDGGEDCLTIRDVQLRAIREFRIMYLTDSLILERSRYDGWPLRTLSEEFGGDPGNLCRRLPRIEAALRQHVLSAVATWWLRDNSVCVVSAETALPIVNAPLFAVMTDGLSSVVRGPATAPAIGAFLSKVWSRFLPFDAGDGTELRTRYFGCIRDHQADETQIGLCVLAPYDEAMALARSADEPFIYDVMLDLRMAA